MQFALPNLFARRVVASLLIAIFATLPATAQTRGKNTKPATAQVSAPVSFAQPNQAMSASWSTGSLPAALAVPAGNPDAAIAELARKINAGDSSSTAAVITALQFAGFFVTSKTGEVELTPENGRGQGLPINAWEVASVAKMLGDGKRTSLTDLGTSLESVPFLNELPKKNQRIADLLLDGIKTNAENKQNPYLRSWARLIIELGKNSSRPQDVSSLAADKIELDALQHLLITRRLYGDLWGRAEKIREQFPSVDRPQTTAFLETSDGSRQTRGPSADTFDEVTTDDKAQPCRMDGNAPTIMDAAATITGVGWDKMLGYLEDVYQGTPTETAIKKFGLYQAAANIILAYAKFIQTYAALETRIAAEDTAPLIRTKNAVPGARKRLKAEVRMNLGNWQMYNCIRLAMNTTTGLDFATLNDGPIGDVGVQWGLTSGGAGDFYSNSTGINQAGEQIVGFAADSPRRIQDTTGPGKQIRAGNLTFTKTDDKGIAENILEGTPQRNAKLGRVFEIRKEARVVTSIKIKAGEIKGDMVDVAGQAIAGIPGLITMPAELLYRTSWAASGALIVPVTDWEECGGGWSGTISITQRRSESRKDDKPKKGVRTVTEFEYSSRKYEYDGTINIRNAKADNVGGVSATNRAVVSAVVPLEGEASATSSLVWESQESSYYDDNCGSKNAIKRLFKANRKEQSGSGKVVASGTLSIDYAANTYQISILIPGFAGKWTERVERRPSGYCTAADNRAQDTTNEGSIEIDRMPIQIDDGVVDPKKPDLIEGSRSFTTSSGEEVEIRWSLKNCR